MSTRESGFERSRRHVKWVRANFEKLRAIGLPLHVYEGHSEWEDFLENGHLHWHNDPQGFSFEELNAGQARALARVLEERYGENDRIPPLLGWLRARQADGTL